MTITTHNTLLIDLDGVIRYWDRTETMAAEEHDIPCDAVQKIAFSPELLLPAITGQVTDEEWGKR